MFWRKLGRVLDLYAGLVAAWAAAWQLWRDRWGALGLANAWGFWLLVTGVPLGAARLWRRSPWLARGWLAAGLALLARRYVFTVTGPGEGGPAGSAQAPGDGALRLLSFNILQDNAAVDTAAGMIRGQGADVVALQELEPEIARALGRALADEYPYRHYQAHARPGGGLGVYSRVPFAVTGLLESPGQRPHALRVTLELPGGPLDLYNVHLLPTAGPVLRRMGPTANFRLRAEQARGLRDEMQARGLPALAMGDYNLTEGSEAYQLLREGLVDVWRVAGSGPGWTWPRSLAPWLRATTPPVLRIDYCFCTRAVAPSAMHVVRDRLGSDHCPIVVDVRMAPGEAALPVDWLQRAERVPASM